jgi:glycosyltransferase involved in cell wall biosynthesis
MRIGVDACCWSNKRGFGRFTRELLKSLVTIDNENDYLFFADKDTASANGFPDGVKIVEASTKISPIKAASAYGRRSFRDLWAMSREVLRYKLDLFFFPAVYSYYPIINSTKIIVTIHDMTTERYPKEIFPNKKLMLFWKLKQYLAVRQAHLILAVSQYSKEEITKFCGVPESHVSVVSEAANSTFRVLPPDAQMAPVLRRYGLNPSKRFLLYVGGISPHKNLKTLVEAYFELMKNPLFSDVKLVLVGDYKTDSFHSDYPALQQLVNDLQLDRKVIFTGYIEDSDLAYLYNAASLLVFPSLQEGFGLPALEAMACGTPVAASNAGSLPEILGDAGCLFDPLSQEEMLGVIRRVLSAYDLRREMSFKGLERARQFSWNKSAEDLLTIFDNLVNGSPWSF